MCGRFAVYSSAEAIASYAKALQKIQKWDPNFNISPGTMVPIIYNDASNRLLTTMRFGLIPFWAKDEKFASKLINARSESIADKPSFRYAFEKRRCLIVANGYYEWEKSSKKPYYFYNPEQEIIFFAGIWESWKSPNGEIIKTCSIITKPAAENINHIHHRMPVILNFPEAENWLINPNKSELINILYNFADEKLVYHPVSIAVNSSRNNYPDLIQPIAI